MFKKIRGNGSKKSRYKGYSRFSMLVVVMVFSWFLWFSHSYDDGVEIDKSGFSISERVFNYHPVLMVLGMIHLNFSAVSYFAKFNDQHNSREEMKNYHVIIHILAMISVFFGMLAVDKAHEGKPEISSLHNTLGGLCLLLYIGQFVFGYLSYKNNSCITVSSSFKERTILGHKIVGLLLALLAMATVVSGVTELLEHHQSCNAILSSEEPDNGNRFLHGNHEAGVIKTDCVFGIGLAIFVIVLTAWLLSIIAEIPSKTKKNPHFQPLEQHDLEFEEEISDFEIELQ